MFKNFKGNKKPYLFRIIIAAIIFILSCVAFLPVGRIFTWILALNFKPLIVRTINDFSLFALFFLLLSLLLAFIFGRFYCSVICPFGILQDIIGTVLRRKSGKSHNFMYLRYSILLVSLAFCAIGITAVFRFVDPYSNFGNILTAFLNIKTVSLLAFVPLVLLIVLVAVKNRIFCTTICPVGTILGLFSKFNKKGLVIDKNICKKCGLCENECPTGAINSKKQTLDNERCIRCMRCIAKCPGGGIVVGSKSENLKFNPSRRDFIGAGVVIALSVGVLAKGKEVVTTIIENMKKLPICPAGAKSVEEFTQKCTNCGLCAEHCPNNIIKKPDEEYDTVHLDFSEGKCDYNCKNCSDVCPTGALQKMSLEEKQNCRIGLAKFVYEKCIKCGLCAHICPKGAIEFVAGKVPYYNAQKCIGCGACQNICATKAIKIVPIKVQDQIN